MEVKQNRSIKKRLIIVMCFISIVIFGGFITIKYDIYNNFNLIVEELSTGKIETDAGTYIGNAFYLNDNHGGKFVFNSGDTYEGSWNKKIIEYGGTYEYVGIGIYKGNFENGVRDGMGTFVWNDGSEYNGNWNEDKIEGEGKLIFPNYSYLEGVFLDNKFINGEYVFVNDTAEYRFLIKESDFTNKIEILFENGTFYEGTYKSNSITGRGTITFPNEDRYEGTLVDGKKQGRGVYTWISGATYEGQWLQDKMDGNGVYTFSLEDINDGVEEVDEITKNETLSGAFKNNKPNGVLIYSDADGNKYKTTWEKGKCIKVSGEK